MPAFGRHPAPCLLFAAICAVNLLQMPEAGAQAADAPALRADAGLAAGDFELSADSVRTDRIGNANVVVVHGSIALSLDRARLSADDAVIWIEPEPGSDSKLVTVALLGNARIARNGTVRSGRELLIRGNASGHVRLHGQIIDGDLSHMPAYEKAAELVRREVISAAVIPAAAASAGPPTDGTPVRRWIPAAVAQSVDTASPPRAVKPAKEVDFDIHQFTRGTTADGDTALVLSGGTQLRYRDDKGNLIEFISDQAVIFTDLKNLRDITREPGWQKTVRSHVISAYFEGDVQVYFTPANSSSNELRMRAERVYYEFASDRAILTDVVFHTVDIKRQIPVFLRAAALRQLSLGQRSAEYSAEGLELTTSALATPSYSLAADKAYVKAENTGIDSEGERVSFSADNAYFKAYGLPLFWLPYAGGTMTARGSPLRQISAGHTSQFGFGVRSDFGLFETLGEPHPKEVDADYRIDYFDKRGIAGGVDARYAGGIIDETSKTPQNFSGELKSYFVNDRGKDYLGGQRALVDPPGDLRGRAFLDHQHFFGDGWQAQLRLGWASDATFIEQWFPDEFWNSPPLDESVYLKHQQDSEFFSIGIDWQPYDFVTSADLVQEQAQVQRLPEITYHRVGDSVLNDRMTFFSDNSFSSLSYASSAVSARQQGFLPSMNTGIPSFGYNGQSGGNTYRGDFREEIDWPINAGPIKIVPYIFGRFAPYSRGVTPSGIEPVSRTLMPGTVDVSGAQNRLFVGGGTRIATSFWNINDAVESDLFDLHRIRHVIEPEINFFTSAQTVDQNRLLIYDPAVDGINDVQAVEVALRQRWQTKRGGAGRWRSVDVFTFNVALDLYANQPAPRFRDPTDFRGFFLPTMPEASIPRNSLNFDGSWRITDSTELLADLSHNFDLNRLATAGIGLAVQRGERLSYFIGNRYINDLRSNITSVQINYDLSRKYSINLAQSFDFGKNTNVSYSATVVRKFDRFSAAVRLFYDQTTNNKGFAFEVSPFGVARGVGSDEVQPGL